MRTIFVYFLLFVGVKCQGYYKVISPKAIRPNSEYHIAISIAETSEPTTVTTTLKGYSRNGTLYSTEDRVVVQPYSSKISRLLVGDIQEGDYKLVVSGRGGVDFQSNYPLVFVNKSYSVFIQTDKAIYKPGTLIQFRAIILNSELKPAAEVRNERILIFVTDGQGNKVKEWRNIQAIKGVFTGELKLAISPVLGDWNISVTIHGQTFSKTIQVAEYILPKFLVNIQAPKHMTFKDNNLVINVQTLYNYGKKVKGEATVTVYPTIYSGVIQPIFQNPIRKVLAIDGSATVDFDIAYDLKLNDEYERIIIVDVVVEEANTSRRQNNSVEIHLHKFNYKLDLIKTADYFKPGLKYTAYVKVTNYDNTPLQSDEVTIRYGYSRLDEVYTTEKHKLDKNGVMTLEFTTLKNVTNGTALRIEAEYQGLKERMSPVPAAVSFSNNFLLVSLETERPIINLDVEVLVNCTEPMKYINYVLIGRGDVLIANTFQVDNRKEYRFHFTATHAMVPVSHLYVSYIRSDGELIADSINIEIDGLLQNFIDIQVNTVETEPGMDVDLTIRAQPNSYIGLLAIDQNLQKLRPGFDLSTNFVSEELKMYDQAPQSPYNPIMKDPKYHFVWKPGASNSYSAILDSGAELLTNSIVNRRKPTLEDIYLRPVFYGSSTVKPDTGFGLPLHSVTRPPLAGPYAFSRIPKPVWNRPKVYLTEDVANTWLFTNFSSGFEGKTSIRRKIPNTMNTWIITGFSLNPIHGLGIVTMPKKIKVHKSFMVTMELPYSVQRGEVLAVPVVVYNNLDRDVNAEITLHNPENKFEFAEISRDINSTSSRKIELYKRKKVDIKRNSATTVSFMIAPLKQGLIEIKVTANSPRNQDVVVKNLLVTTGGETEYYTKTILIDLRKSGSFKKQINFTLPKNLVEGSEKIEVSTVGDLLGTTMINLENIIRLPTGCGEQNLIHIMPPLIILQYLKTIKEPNPTIEDEARTFIETAYQQQLSYRKKDGSFSIFGQQNSPSSVFLTAYVALTLKQVKPFIYVDQKIIDSCLKWLEEVQGKNGGFFEIGPVIHQDLQGRNDNSLALTAFTLLAFIENQNSNPSYINTINKGLDYIARNIDETKPIYSIALCSYVLQLTRHASKQSAFNILDARSKGKDNKKWWAKDISSNEIRNPFNKLPKSIDIEMTSYALLSFLEANFINDAIPILNWLIEQQNSIGGFTTTQDSFIGLFALYKLVTKLSIQSNMQVEFVTAKDRGKFNINSNSAMIVQKMEISKSSREVNVTAQGSGLVLFRVSYQYNMNVTGPWPLFTLDPQVDKNSNLDHLQMSICTGFVSRNLSSSTESNMAVMEVTLPSGFTIDTDSLPSLQVSQNVQKVETGQDLTKVYLYFNNLTSLTEYCPTVSAFRTYKIANQKPVSVVVYDYYDSSRKARLFYRRETTTLCDICEKEDCGDCSSTFAKKQVGSNADIKDEKGGCVSINFNWICLLIATFAIFFS